MSKRGRQDDQDSVTRAIEVICCRHPAPAEVAYVRLTPLEQQVVALKASIAPHVVLMVACGYRVKFYGCDSRAVSRRVGIMCIPGQPFEYSSFPYTRVDLYVHRLVEMGYQVAFADQESAAMRAADGQKSGLFTRAVSQLYSRATLLPSEHVVTNGGGGGGSSTARGGAAAEAEEHRDEADGGGEEGEGEEAVAGDAAGLSTAAYTTVDASELFLCFLRADATVESDPSSAGHSRVKDEDSTLPTTSSSFSSPSQQQQHRSLPPLEMTLVSFVTQRRLRFVVHTALEMEDITQRLDIAEVVVLTTHAPRPPQHDSAWQRSTAAFVSLLPEAYSAALQHALALHFGPTANGEEDGKNVTVSGFVMAARQDTDSAIAAYLRPFKLDQVYGLLCARQRPAAAGDGDTAALESSRSLPPWQDDKAAPSLHSSPLPTMQLPGPTLRALDVFHSSAGLRGSLLGLLDRSLTACGARCLRRWLAAPLSCWRAIGARQAAVAYLASGSDAGQVEELLRECARLGDVEAVLGKLHAERCGVIEFVRLLRMVRGVAALANQLGAEAAEQEEQSGRGVDGGGADGCPALLRELLSVVCGPAVARLLEASAQLLDSTATTPLEFFTECGRPTPAALQTHVEAKRAAEAALEAELRAARATLQLPGLEYRTIAGSAYLLDIPQGKCGRVPADWVVQTRTKTNVRYHTPVIVQQSIARTAAMERLGLAAAAAWREYQREVVADAAVVGALGGVVDAIGALDALRSLALVSRQPGYVTPRLVAVEAEGRAGSGEAEGRPLSVSIRDGRHPVLDQLLPHGYVSCDVELRAGGAWLLTGPNMGGKSALMRMVGCFAILAQIGCGVPAAAATLPVFCGVYCRMGASDSILEGSSTFLSEMDETSRILRAPDLGRSLVLMDELGRGTSSFDGAAVAAATLEYLLARHATTIFVTHYSYLCEPYLTPADAGSSSSSSALAEAERQVSVSCYYMGFREAETTPGDASTRQLVFTYKPCRGVTPSSFGVAIGRKAGLPASVTEAASALSAAVESEHRAKQDAQELRLLMKSDSM